MAAFATYLTPRPVIACNNLLHCAARWIILLTTCPNNTITGVYNNFYAHTLTYAALLARVSRSRINYWISLTLKLHIWDPPNDCLQLQRMRMCNTTRVGICVVGLTASRLALLDNHCWCLQFVLLTLVGAAAKWPASERPSVHIYYRLKLSLVARCCRFVVHVFSVTGTTFSSGWSLVKLLRLL